MNQRERMQRIKENYNKYHIPGMTNIHRIKRNAVFISTANSLKHELKKLEICYELKKAGKEFITEAEKNSRKGEAKRRVDIVDLVTGDIIEVETNKRIKKKDATFTIYI